MSPASFVLLAASAIPLCGLVGYAFGWWWRGSYERTKVTWHSPTATELLALADRIEACLLDAKRPEIIESYGASGNLSRNSDHRVICLANGLQAIVEALRARAAQEPKP